MNTSLKVGWGQKDMTPRSGPVIIAGRIPFRKTDVIHDPLSATAMVVEGNNTRTVWVSCDMCHPTRRVFDDIAELLCRRLPGFDKDQLIVSSTHATACFYLTDDEFLGGGYDVELEGVEPLEKTRKTVCEAAADAVVEAYSNLEECTCTYGKADILTGFCRRTLFKDNTAVMYGDVHREDFLRMESPDGGPSQFVYFYRKSDGSLRGIFANVPCPSQADESSVHITSDYWGIVRRRVWEAFGPDVKVLATCRAAGELSPHEMITYETRKEERWGRKPTERLGNHIADHLILCEKNPLFSYGDSPVHKHLTRWMDFPVRQATEADYQAAVAYQSNPDNFNENGRALDWHQRIQHGHVLRLKELNQQVYTAKVSAVQIGDLLFFTAPVELYSEYANRIAMRFPGHPVLDVQLSDDNLGYLPTQDAIDHGGYSTLLFSTITGADGGELYVSGVTQMLEALLTDIQTQDSEAL